MASLIVVAGLAVLMCKAHGANTTIYIEPEPDDGLRTWALHAPKQVGDAPIVYPDGKTTLTLGFDKLTDLTAANFHFKGLFEPDITAVSLEGDIMKPELSVERIPENGTYVEVSIVGKPEYTFDPIFKVWDLRTGMVTDGYLSPILSDLVVEYSEGSGNLIDFDPYIKTYVIHPEAGKPSVEVSKAEWPEAEVKMRLSNTDPLDFHQAVNVPDPGFSAEVIYVSVSKMFAETLLTSEYRVVIAPPQNGADDDRTLMYLDVFYAYEDDSLISFSKSVTDYTVNVSEAKQNSSVKVVYPLTSSEHSNVEITYGENEETAVSVTSGQLVPVPAPGAALAKKFFVKVTAQDGNHMNYIITIYPYTAPEATTSWRGTVTLNNLSDKTAVQVVVREADIYKSRTATVTDWSGTQGNWTLDAPASFEPVSFIVAITDNDTSTEISRSKQYKKDRELAAGAVNKGSQVHLTVDGAQEVGKGVFSYQDVVDFNNHKGTNYSLADDVTLLENWPGSPEDYYGRFYGNGYTIKNLKFTQIKCREEDAPKGLFRTLGENAQIHDLTILVPKTSSPTYIIATQSLDFQMFFGAVVGYTSYPNILISGVTVKGGLNLARQAGNNNSRHFSFGGFIGQLGDDDGHHAVVEFRNCVSDMEIEIDTGETLWNGGEDYGATKSIGGFVGYVWNSSASFTNCYSTGSITTNKIAPANGGAVIGGFVAGLGGWQKTEITNCYSSVAIDSALYQPNNNSNGGTNWNNEQHVLGGFLGVVEPGYSIDISKTLALNPHINGAKGSIDVGRLIGRVDAGSGTRSYSDLFALNTMTLTANSGTVNPVSNSSGKDGASKSASELDEIFWVSKDFDDKVWDFSPLSKSGWPTLK
jgi:hypothetical protein